jgi:hypothetical protein
MRNLLSVAAADRLSDLDGLDLNSNTVRVASGLVDAGADPDTPGTVDAVRAGEEAGAVECEGVGSVQGEVSALAVANDGLSASRVAELALACFTR